MIAALLFSLAAAAGEIYTGELIVTEGRPPRLRIEEPRESRGEVCLKFASPKLARSKALIGGLHVRLEVTSRQDGCLVVKSMKPAIFDPARPAVERRLKRPR